ncbi:MAG TPA: RNase adapter RapZ [Alphaproteobacteria bacterium]|jgi:RNase adaptor protein for sRNA GlmZ degradation
MSDLCLHATCVAIGGAGVLLRGPSGAGKSDLALRLIEAGAKLVADDQVLLAVENGRLVARAPASIAGQLEVRGVGIVPVATVAAAPVALVADLVAADAVERLPEPESDTIVGVALARLQLAPFEVSAPAKLRLALARAAGNIAPAAAGAAMPESPAPAPGQTETARPRVLLITGLSGAGRSTALNAFEDMGYETVDNLPATLVAALVQPEAARDRPLAIGIDIRTRDFGAAPFLATVDALRARDDIDFLVLFLDCDDETLLRRYSQTRRRHPLAHDRPVADGIGMERRRLAQLRDRADWVVDTTDLTEGDLRRELRSSFSLARTPAMAIIVMSFAYGQGIPRAADLVFDVRFLKNPHYLDNLRDKTGEDPEVGAYIEGDQGYAEFFQRLVGFIEPLLPRYRAEGKSYLTVAVGCTGGRHRSVYIAEKLGAWLAARGYRAAIRHRELERDKVLG